jgi:hypothetical protein
MESKFASFYNWVGRRDINSDWDYIRGNFKILTKYYYNSVGTEAAYAMV